MKEGIHLWHTLWQEAQCCCCELTMDLVIPEAVLQAAKISPDELKREIAVLLFAQEKLTLAQASKLSGLNRLQFQRLLAERSISVHYDANDFQQDLVTLRDLGELDDRH